VEGGRTKLHADIAHPINSRCREYIQEEIVKAYQDELERSKQPGYQPQDLDAYDDDFHGSHFGDHDHAAPAPVPTEPPPAPTESSIPTPAPEVPPQQAPETQPQEEPEKKPDNTGFADGIY
jgi:stage V sporulation protein G